MGFQMTEKDRHAQGAASEVLIIEDHPTTARAIAKLLSNEGFRASVCHTGAEAMAYAQQNRPAAALVDIHLPDISGLTLSARLREHFGQGTPIIMLSGDSSIETLRSLSPAGADYFISKPFLAEHLIDRLRELTSKP